MDPDASPRSRPGGVEDERDSIAQSIEDVSVIELNPMHTQQGKQLFLEIAFLVMFGLMLKVRFHVWLGGLADGENAIPLLPGKRRVIRIGPMNPYGRSWFRVTCIRLTRLPHIRSRRLQSPRRADTEIVSP